MSCIVVFQPLFEHTNAHLKYKKSKNKIHVTKQNHNQRDIEISLRAYFEKLIESLSWKLCQRRITNKNMKERKKDF